MDKSIIRQKPQRIRIKADKTPKNEKNILRLQQSRCTIPWSHDTGVDNQHSRHAITWPHREKQKWTKAPQVERAKGSESRRTKPPKMRKYFKTPRIKVYDPMITWYRYGQSTFSSCHHVAAKRKAKMEKSTILQKQERIRIKVDKTPKNEKNILRLQQSRCTIPWSHDTGVDNQHSHHAITWLHREKQKWTKAPQVERAKGSESRRTKPPKMRKYFTTPTIKVYDQMITWYRYGQSTFSSYHHVAAQRKAKMDKSTTGRKPQRIRIKVDKTPQNEKIF